jgi:hypothetical protein
MLALNNMNNTVITYSLLQSLVVAVVQQGQWDTND